MLPCRAANLRSSYSMVSSSTHLGYWYPGRRAICSVVQIGRVPNRRFTELFITRLLRGWTDRGNPSNPEGFRLRLQSIDAALAKLHDGVVNVVE
jgi:hypothetical protein